MTCIHLGLSKAASTTLQRHLFAEHSQIEYLGKWRKNGFVKPFVKEIASQLPTCANDATLEMWRRSVSEIIIPAIEIGRVPMFSKEGLSKGSDHAKLAMNIERVFGPSKVILVVRHPLRWVESRYIQCLLKELKPRRKLSVGYFTIEDYLTQSWNQEGRGRLKCLMSRKILEPYVAQFGKQNVGVFMFEHLQSDPQGFIEAICEFIGVDPVEGIKHATNKHKNPRVTRDNVEQIKMIHQSTELTRIFRQATREDRCRMIKSDPDSPTQGEPATVEIPEVWRSRIEELVRDDCNYLRQEFGLPVDEAGYPI